MSGYDKHPDYGGGDPYRRRWVIVIVSAYIGLIAGIVLLS
jgi:hypothetical protein